MLTRLFWLVIIGYLFFTIGRAINKNYQSNRQVKTLKEEIVILQNDIKRQELLNIYFQSETFKELEARRRLALKKTNEKVYILPAREQGEIQIAPEGGNSKESSETDSNPRKWLRFLVGI